MRTILVALLWITIVVRYFPLPTWMILPFTLIMWTVFFMVVLPVPHGPFWWVAFVGMVANFAVMMVNRGFMPVVGQLKTFSIWKAAAPTDRLLFLADRASLAFFSPGDLIIIGAGIAYLIYKLFAK